MASKKSMKLEIMPDEVMHTSINKSKDGYNAARVICKKGDNEFMVISYEWEGDSVPDFAMMLMGFMQANEMEMGTQNEEEYAAYKSKKDSTKNDKKGKEKICPGCEKPMSECECD